MLRSLISIVLGIVLLWAGGVRLVADTFYAATVTFSDRQDDKITSDYQTTGSHTPAASTPSAGGRRSNAS